MKTTLYNTETNNRVGDFRNDYYMVNGIRPEIPHPHVELVVENTPPPSQEEGYLLSSVWVADLENKLWKIEWTKTPITTKTLEQCLSEISWNYQQKVEAGAQIGEIKLKMDDTDRFLFTQLLLLLNEAERFGQLPEDTSITDYNGQVLTLPTLEVRMLLVQLGLIYQSVWVRKTELLELAANANSDEDRFALDLSFL
jgi:hypothetical protein